MQTVTKSPSKANAKDKVKALRKRIDDSIDTLAKAVDDVRTSAMFKAYLDVQAKFHKYSWCNTLLIYSQKPDASNVAGFQTWKKLGRHVRKGEHGIMIFAPCPWKKDGKNGEKDESGIYFKAVHVFDVSQTDGKELPTIDAMDVETVADDLLANLARVTHNRGIALTFETINGGAYGVSKKGSIVVDPNHSTGQQAKTLAHELAHESMHWEDRGQLTRSIAELEAESVAYVVCRHFNLDTSIRSSRYIALWQGDGKALRASLERISKTARAIIDDVTSLDCSKAVA